MSTSYNYKQITDPVHSTIGISELEAKVINSEAFQRLRSVKQLGLAHLVFPGADYSRFSHSLGVCHVTGLILQALKNSGQPFEEKKVQRYRLAGLLHDVGHYPFSHAMEEAIADHYSAELLNDSAEEASTHFGRRFYDHEDLGGLIVGQDPELKALLKDAGFEPEAISSLFRREDPEQHKNLISSDFDADRIDYLMRTARHSGLPYGSIDLPYLLSQLRRGPNDEICLSHKAVRAADHFLLSRYFDYAQVAYHKTVAALELVLKDTIGDLLRSGQLACRPQDIRRMLSDGSWASFCDADILKLIEELARSSGEAAPQLRARAIIQRKPPKLIWELEELVPLGAGNGQRNMAKRLIRANKPTWANYFDIPMEHWKEWSVGTTLTKIGALVSPSLLAQPAEDDRDKYEQAVKILLPDNSTRALFSYGRSLMSVLAKHEMVKVRLYVLVPPRAVHRVDEIRARVERDMEA